MPWAKASECAAHPPSSRRRATTSRATCRRANWCSRSRICSWPSAERRTCRSNSLPLQQFELFRHAFPLLGIGRGRLFLADHRPFLGQLRVQLEKALLAVRDLFFRKNGFHGAFRLAQRAVDTLIGIDHQKIRAFVEAVDGTYLHAIHIFALDAAFGDHECHDLPFS